jgi:condensin complex subunit 2
VEPAEIANKLAGLRNQFFPDLSKLDNQDICPSLKNVDFSAPGTLDIPFLKALEDRDGNVDFPLPNAAANDDSDGGGGGDMAFGFDDGYGIGGDDMTMAFGEGGEAWANETIADAADRLLSPSKRPPLGFGGPADKEAGFDPDSSRNFGVAGGAQEDILSYFDEALRKNWAGPEHWRIRRIKDSSKPATAPVRTRKEKEAFEIDFMNPGADITDEMLVPPKTAHTINLPKRERISNTRNLLPDDKHFNSRQLIRLFLKPKALATRRKQYNAGPVGAQQAEPPENLDEEFWAKENMAGEIQASSTPDPKANYDANFFNDDNLDLPAGLGDDDDDDAFADAREAFSPGVNGTEIPGAVPSETVPMSQFPTAQAIDFGTQLVTQSRRTRPEYMQYARVAKKVDVRKLKENIWSGLKFEATPSQNPDVVCVPIFCLA